MVAQSDNLLNQGIAADSKEVALASQRDSTAMKAIALLTMVFLPGTYMAVSLYLSLQSLQLTPQLDSLCNPSLQLVS